MQIESDTNVHEVIGLFCTFEHTCFYLELENLVFRENKEKEEAGAEANVDTWDIVTVLLMTTLIVWNLIRMMTTWMPGVSS